LPRRLGSGYRTCMGTAPTATRAPSIGALKLAQAQSLLESSGLDAWLIVVRESAERPDPILRFFFDLDFTWTTFFLVTRDWSAALVATFDAPDLVRLGLFDDVVTYKEGPRGPLLDALADGITAGLRDHLVESLAGTPYASRITSAAPLLAVLRGVKLEEERALVSRAVDETELMFDRVRDLIRVGQTAKQIAAEFHAETARAGVPTAWPRHHCPTVTVGAKSPIGHVGPSDEPVTLGCGVHVDFGIILNGYCSDLQRLWYVAPAGGGEAPEPVRRAYQTIVEAIELGARSLVPGALGWEVDEKARKLLLSRGYPEYPHALGHHLGRAVHDGGGVLGPRWERYGREPFEPVRVGNVYTLEPSIHLEDHGLISLEEDVVVGPKGAEFLSRFPRELPILRLR
jgi:Xaa-Pro aminopeptidase